eukprot:920984-Prorocentrum_lima.AAC.1
MVRLVEWRVVLVEEPPSRAAGCRTVRSTRPSRGGSKMAATRSAECPSTPLRSLTRIVRTS